MDRLIEALTAELQELEQLTVVQNHIQALVNSKMRTIKGLKDALKGAEAM